MANTLTYNSNFIVLTDIGLFKLVPHVNDLGKIQSKKFDSLKKKKKNK